MSTRILRAVLPIAVLASCGSSDDTDSFVVHDTSAAAAAGSQLETFGRWLAWFADEATTGPAGTDLNGDGDATDEVAMLVDFDSGLEEAVGVAGTRIEVFGNEVYVLADESDDGVDWSGDDAGGPFDDFAIVHYDVVTNARTFVDTVDPTDAVPMVAVSDRLFYRSLAAPQQPDETTLRYVDAASPTVSMPVFNAMGAGQARPEIVREEEELLFCLLDEAVEGAALNGDGVADGDLVLALVDGDDPSLGLHSTGVAVAGASVPIGAHFDFGTGDRLVGFLVSEAAEGASLNDAGLFTLAWQPPQCTTVDADTTDQVLHWLRFDAFVAATEGVRNTGLAGSLRVVAIEDFVATLVPEDDADCNLNGDDDSTDLVARWVEAMHPPLPPGGTEQLHAVAQVPGGSSGLAHVRDVLVITASETDDERELDGKPAANDLVASLRPALGPGTLWSFEHVTFVGGEPFVGASWMADRPTENRLGVAYQESVPGQSFNNNLLCDLVQKDADTTDSLVTWSRHDPGTNRLVFPGLGYAVETGNAGIVQARGTSFFRVSEAEDDIDYNGDGDLGDRILVRNPIFACSPVHVAEAGAGPGPVVETDAAFGAAWMAPEDAGGIDYDGDGDAMDDVVRWFRF